MEPGACVGQVEALWLEELVLIYRVDPCNKTLASGPMGDSLPIDRDSYLVDPASSHMLVSKIKPCMSKYKRIHTVKLRMAH